MQKLSRQEVLLVTSATTAKMFCNKNRRFKETGSVADRLEEAVWSGLLYDLLGALVEHSEEGKPLNLWQVRQGNEILGVELCNHPQPLERHFSIDPYIFLYGMMWN